jgi:hypothetical protein
MVLTVLAVLFIEQANASVNLNVLFGFKAIVSNDRGPVHMNASHVKRLRPQTYVVITDALVP